MLEELDAGMQACFEDDKYLSKVSGYHEAIQAIICPDIPLGKIKWVILKIQYFNLSQSLKTKLDLAVDQLCTSIKPSIVPCPEEKQPKVLEQFRINKIFDYIY